MSKKVITIDEGLIANPPYSGGNDTPLPDYALTDADVKKILITLRGKGEKGGPGSGFFGHAGRVGQVGGSMPQAGSGAVVGIQQQQGAVA